MDKLLDRHQLDWHYSLNVALILQLTQLVPLVEESIKCERRRICPNLAHRLLIPDLLDALFTSMDVGDLGCITAGY